MNVASLVGAVAAAEAVAAPSMTKYLTCGIWFTAKSARMCALSMQTAEVATPEPA